MPCSCTTWHSTALKWYNASNNKKEERTTVKTLVIKRVYGAHITTTDELLA